MKRSKKNQQEAKANSTSPASERNLKTKRDIQSTGPNKK
jgi:hypothetical protein